MGFGAGWYYNDVSGDVVHASAFTSIGEFLVPGWHGPYKTEEEALLHPGVKGAPSAANMSVLGAGGAAAENAVPGATTVGHFLGQISNRHFITRAVEVILGGLLVVIALNQFLGKPAQQAAGVAKVANPAGAAKTAAKAIK